MGRDPFAVSLEEKLGLLLEASEALDLAQGCERDSGTMDLHRQHIWFLTSEGTDLDQTIVNVGSTLRATATDDDNMPAALLSSSSTVA